MKIKKIRNFFNLNNRKNEEIELKIINIGAYKLQATSDSRLDEFMSTYPNYSKNFSELVELILRKDPISLIIDIGANIGDTVALIRTTGIQNRIFCVEGNPTYINLFNKNINQFDDVVLVEAFLNEQDTPLDVSIITEEGTAKILLSKKQQSINTTSLDSLVLKYELDKIRIIKVDTDGFDVRVLLGAENTIEKYKPVIFYEYDNSLNSSETSCYDFLISLSKYGYQSVIFYDNYGNLLIRLGLDQINEIFQLDKYISNGCGACEYYDIAVFHKSDELVVDFILSTKYNS